MWGSLQLYNLSLSSNCFPSNWKISFVKPIKKINDLTHTYRLISIISIIPKLFESVVSEKYAKYFILASLLNDDQHGFLKRKSTTINLLIFQNDLLDDITSGYQVDIIFTDFTKAFYK